MTVGRSWRTPAKHQLMRSLIGKEVGVVSRKPEIQRSVWFDLTAGDAVVGDGQWEFSCSPGILAHHAAKSRKPVTVCLYEIKPATYDRLLNELTERLPMLGYKRGLDHVWTYNDDEAIIMAFNKSGSDAPAAPINRGDAVFALNDPNAITDWAMRDTFAAEVDERTPWFRSLSTMGCNPGGLKRLEFAERQQWFNLLANVEAAQPRHRDLLLTAIERDDAQWAYLMSEPRRWASTMETTARSAFKRFGLNTVAAWWRRDPDGYRDLKHQLFLTRSERKAAS